MGVGLLLAALVVGVAGPAYLRRAVDAGARPRVALGAWLGTGAVFVLLLVAAPVAMLVRPLAGFAPAAEAVSACAGVFGPGVGTGWPSVVRGAVVATGAATALVAVAVAAAAVAGAGRAGRAHVRSLRSLVERVDRVDGVTVWWIADDEPVAYAVPGRGCAVVASTALWDLAEDRRRAVLDHEIAHLRGRHHLAVAVARALRSALSVVPLLRRAAAEVAVLVELVADRRAAAGPAGTAAVRGALADLGAPAGRVDVLRAAPVSVSGQGSGQGSARAREAGHAAVHAVSPALLTAALGTAAFLATCPTLAG